MRSSRWARSRGGSTRSWWPEGRGFQTRGARDGMGEGCALREGRGAACCAPTSSVSRGYLLVRVDGRSYGLPLARVLEVGDLAEVLDVPRALPAMRGLTPVRGHLVPVVHLGALMSDGTPPAERGRTAVLVEIGAGGRRRPRAFGVEEADGGGREGARPGPRGARVRRGSGGGRHRAGR